MTETICPASGKFSYSNRKEAIRQMASVRRTGRKFDRNRGELRIYLCPECERYHFGHERKINNKRIRKL